MVVINLLNNLARLSTDPLLSSPPAFVLLAGMVGLEGTISGRWERRGLSSLTKSKLVPVNEYPARHPRSD